ncbi:acyltransferase [Clostridium sp. YIM B02505]|uniref:Acyltransferase n=1 Tax=Clostridium yunnanense TaxID=2800325 RepID=A0ABS1ETU0_9CLOT|nr:acyltransferase [Clostridium yunnanense]MBK1812713.1 acyltransferase [Clostridium yunnanense]
MLKKHIDNIRWFIFMLKNISLSIPKTVYFNFNYFKFRDAIKFPVHIHYKVKLCDTEGSIVLTSKPKFRSVAIGFPYISALPQDISRWNVTGKVVFGENVYIGAGSVVDVNGEGELHIGSNFSCGGGSTIICCKKIKFGDGCIVSWENLFLDTDYHKIYSLETDEIINEPKEIIFGDKVWIGCRSTFIKGAKVGNSCIVGANSFINNEIKGDNIIIGGNPARILKEKVRWEP